MEDTDKPDRFGTYRDLITRLHRPIATWIEEICRISPGSVEVDINQMSIEEYLEQKHDEAYLYHRYRLTDGAKAYRNSEDFPFVLCLNPRAKGIDQIADQFAAFSISVLQEELQKLGPMKLEFQRVTTKLEFTDNDTIQTVHFLLQGDQLFKLVYCFETFGEVFASLTRGRV